VERAALETERDTAKVKVKRQSSNVQRATRETRNVQQLAPIVASINTHLNQRMPQWMPQLAARTPSHKMLNDLIQFMPQLLPL